MASALCLVALWMPLPGPDALEEDENQPVYLEADGAEFDERTSTSVYTGNVYYQQGTIQIRADKVTVRHFPNRRPEHILAIGTPATYRQNVKGEARPVEAEAKRMEYDAHTDEVTLIDEAVLFQGDDTAMRSDRIVWDRVNMLVKAGAGAQGSERVFIEFPPEDEEDDE